MKVFMGEKISCGVNYQFYEIYMNLEEHDNVEIVKEPEEADVIIFADTCCSFEERIIFVMNYIESILARKKEGSKTYLTGCLARELIDSPKLNKVSNWLKNRIDYVIPNNRTDELMRKLFNDEQQSKSACAVAFEDNSMSIYLTAGCSHKCTFCKTQYQATPINSMSLDDVKYYIDLADSDGIDTLDFRGMNVCQFGLDTEHRYMLPEVIEYVETKKNIKQANYVGFAFSDAIKQDFKHVLRNSTKTSLLVGSIESGSNRILDLMDKGYKVEELLDFYQYINGITKKYLSTNVIAGFPTETIDDVRKTVKVLKELKDYLDLVNVCMYKDSDFVASHKLPQLSDDKIKEHAKVLCKFLVKEKIHSELL